MAAVGEVTGGNDEVGAHVEVRNVGQHERERLRGVVQLDAPDPLDDREVCGIGLEVGVGDLHDAHRSLRCRSGWARRAASP